MQDLKVILHVSDQERFINAYNNIKNIIKAKDNVVIHLLLNSNAAKLSVSEDKLSELISKGVTVSVCQNSLNSLNINSENLIDKVNVVAVGVLELVYKQNEGFAYIKP